MRDFVPTLADPTASVERALFAAGRSQSAPPAAKRRAVEVATSVLATTVVAQGMGHAAAKYVWALASKWTAVVGVASIGTAAAFGVARSLTTQPLPPASSRPAAAAVHGAPTWTGAKASVTVASATPSLPLGADVPVIAVQDLPQATWPHVGSRRWGATANSVPPAPAKPTNDALTEAVNPATGSPAPATPTAPTVMPVSRPIEPSMAAELAALDRVRTTLASHAPSAALAGLDEYAARFPHAAMASAATVLRIEALGALGDREPARKLALVFLSENADSPYAPRVSALLSSLAPNP